MEERGKEERTTFKKKGMESKNEGQRMSGWVSDEVKGQITLAFFLFFSAR